MTQEEQAAFVDSYSNNVAHHSKRFVTEFVARYETGMDIEYSHEHTSIMDALGIWHDAVKWKIEQPVKWKIEQQKAKS